MSRFWRCPDFCCDVFLVCRNGLAASCFFIVFTKKKRKPFAIGIVFLNKQLFKYKVLSYTLKHHSALLHHDPLPQLR